MAAYQEEDFEYDIDPESGIQDIGQGEDEYFEYSDENEGEAYAESEGQENDSMIAEADQLELAAELLEAEQEDEIDGVLHEVMAQVSESFGRELSEEETATLGGYLKGVALELLPQFSQESDAASSGRRMGMELEGLSLEDQQFEVSKGVVTLAQQATQAHLQNRPLVPDPVAAKQAVKNVVMSQVMGGTSPAPASAPAPRPSRHGCQCARSGAPVMDRLAAGGRWERSANGGLRLYGWQG